MSLIQKTKNSLIKNISNIPGWTTNRKLVVFLIDDWGAIRIPDKAARATLGSNGIDCESNHFNKFDTLANADDLSALFDVLVSVKDKNNKPAAITALTAVTNPDFDRIKQADFREYYFEPFTHTLRSYYSDSNVFELWKEGIRSGLFEPQFHGREHLNVELWLKALQNGDRNLLAAFEQRAIGIPMSSKSKFLSSYMAAYDFENQDQANSFLEINRKGLSLFTEIFGYNASLFTSSSLIHNSQLEHELLNEGIGYIDRAKITMEPLGGGNYKKRYFYIGQKNSDGQRYITRNCMFEPNQFPDQDMVNKTLNDIDVSFRWHKPAIISSHRVNFVGGIEESNRVRGLKSLQKLLKEIKTKWPEVEFLLFSELSALMNK